MPAKLCDICGVRPAAIRITVLRDRVAEQMLSGKVTEGDGVSCSYTDADGVDFKVTRAVKSPAPAHSDGKSKTPKQKSVTPKKESRPKATKKHTKAKAQKERPRAP